jgi:hypothetical protein
MVRIEALQGEDMLRVLLVFSLCLSAQAVEQWKMYTGEPGVYEVAFADIAQAGFPNDIPVSELALLWRGEPQYRHVLDINENGRFDSGDRIRFYSEHLPGELEHYHEYSKVNVYTLMQDAEQVRAFREMAIPLLENASASTLEASFRAEVDTLAMRFSSNYEPYEMWYWQKLACTDKAPFEITLDLQSPVISDSQSLTLEIGLRGFSKLKHKPTPNFPDHVLHIYLNGTLLPEQAWQGRKPEVLRVENIPASLLKPQDNKLTLQIPRRKDDRDQLVIDVTILNWVKLDYSQTAVAQTNEQQHFQMKSSAYIEVAHSNFSIYSQNGLYFSGTQNGILQFPGDPEKSRVTIVPEQAFGEVLGVAPLQTGNLAPPDGGADYVMIAHHALKEAVKPLAEVHRQRGLRVHLVDVSEIYDGFNHGVVHPRAIRDYLAHAYHNWNIRPRYTLLVGDASYDTKNTKILNENYPSIPFLRGNRTRFNHIPSTKYADQLENNRNLIPSWKTFTTSGHAASDNAFVCVDGDDLLPDISIGRLPVVTPEEVKAIVDKTISYIRHPPVGPHRLNMLMITNEDPHLQRYTNELAASLGKKGQLPHKVYPQSQETSNEHHSRQLQEAINAGQYAIYFHGHGGRFIWRTGPPERRKNHDLFTLKHVEGLKNKDRYPIVYSFTCFSAPFDHPSADSIGESFLRQDGAGAVAFYGASWRNRPRSHANRMFMHHLVEAETLGASIMKTKRGIKIRELIEGYNLLGDPALPLRPLKPTLTLTYQQDRIGITGIEREDAATAGMMMFRDEAGTLLHQQDLKTAITAGNQITIETQPPNTQTIQLYLWNDDHQEWYGTLDFQQLNSP